jgi:lycopene cyclase domain-containing protein
MTYGTFLLVFVVLPLAAACWRWGDVLRDGGWRPLALLLVVVYVATTPWDNAAVAWGLWGFDPARIWGVRLGWLPVEEYLFFGLQAVLTGVLVLHRLRGVLRR